MQLISSFVNVVQLWLALFNFVQLHMFIFVELCLILFNFVHLFLNFGQLCLTLRSYAQILCLLKYKNTFFSARTENFEFWEKRPPIGQISIFWGLVFCKHLQFIYEIKNIQEDSLKFTNIWDDDFKNDKNTGWSIENDKYLEWTFKIANNL